MPPPIHDLPIFRMDAVEERLIGHGRSLGDAENPIVFVGPAQFIPPHVQPPASGLGHGLSTVQIGPVLEKFLFGAEFRQGHGQMIGQPLPETDHLGREKPFAPIVQLQQSQPLLADVQRNQGHRLVSLAVAAVARAQLDGRRRWSWRAVPSCYSSRNFRVAVKNGCEGIEPPADHVSAHALDRWDCRRCRGGCRRVDFGCKASFPEGRILREIPALRNTDNRLRLSIARPRLGNRIVVERRSPPLESGREYSVLSLTSRRNSMVISRSFCACSCSVTSML